MRILALLVVFTVSLTAGVLFGGLTSLLYNYRGASKYGDFSPSVGDPIGSKDRNHGNERRTDYAFTSTSILCWVMTSPDNLFRKAIHITRTWGPRCNLTLYVTEAEPDRPFPGRLLVVPIQGDGRIGLWAKTRAAFIHIFDKYYDRFDWFVKTDDDTFLVVDNLRYFLASKDTGKPVFYGYHLKYLKENFNIDYASGGAGYVISKEVLRRFMGVVTNSQLCPVSSGRENEAVAEDAAFGLCLKNAGVTIEDALDSLGRSRFLPMSLSHYMKGVEEFAPWLPGMSPEGVRTGLNCCSDYLISMHYIQPEQIYVMEYITQHFRLASRSKYHSYVIDGKNIPIEPAGVPSKEEND